MKRIGFSLSAGLAALALGGSAMAGPDLVLNYRGFDFGKVIRGEPVEAELTMRNIGDQTLRIERAKAG